MYRLGTVLMISAAMGVIASAALLAWNAWSQRSIAVPVIAGLSNAICFVSLAISRTAYR